MKKIIVLLLALVFVFTFAACKEETKTRTKDSDDDETSESSVAESKETSSIVTVVSEEESSEAEESEVDESIAVVGDVYNGDGYSFTIPENLTFASEMAGTATFKASDNFTQLNIQTVANATGLETITKEELEASFSALLGETALSDYQTGTVDGENAVYCMYIMTVGTVEVNSYTMIIFTAEDMITVSLAAYNVDMEDEFFNMIDTFIVD